MTRPSALGEFEQSVLLAIAHLGDAAYGVTVRAEIERRTGRDVTIGALYTALERLEQKGYATSRMSDPTPERGGRSRRYFQLRPAGVRALQQSRQVLDRMWQGLSPETLAARTKR